MKCFHHPDRDAVAICKACNKGLCPDCAVDVGHGMACKDQCVEIVNGLVKSEVRVSNSSKYYGKFYWAISWAFGLMAVLSLIGSVNMREHKINIASAGLAIFFVFMALVMRRQAILMK